MLRSLLIGISDRRMMLLIQSLNIQCEVGKSLLGPHLPSMSTSGFRWWIDPAPSCGRAQTEPISCFPLLVSVGAPCACAKAHQDCRSLLTQQKHHPLRWRQASCLAGRLDREPTHLAALCTGALASGRAAGLGTAPDTGNYSRSMLILSVRKSQVNTVSSDMRRQPAWHPILAGGIITACVAI